MSLSDVGSLFRRSGFQDVLVRAHVSRHNRNAFGSPKTSTNSIYLGIRFDQSRQEFDSVKPAYGVDFSIAVVRVPTNENSIH